MPVTDEFFRYLFAIGTISPTIIKRVWVCDKHPTAELNARFQQLLGPMGRTRYLIAPMTFTDMGKHLVNSEEHIKHLGVMMEHLGKGAA